MKRLLHSFWNRFYSGIEIFNIDPVKKIALTHQLVYVPCHRSHVDYLLLSYVIFHEGLALPYIAAGNNLDMPVIGKLLRGGGAFFIRRSFRNNPLYSTVMTEYVRELIDMGIPLEYFVEGGRSRTGRLLTPKLGMLSMTVDAWISSQNKPLAFIPVYIGYQKLLEGKSYVGELYGEKKQKESLFTSIKSILSLKGQFGKVTTSFGKPIILGDLLSQQKADWNSDNLENAKQHDWFRKSIKVLSNQILFEINQAAVIQPVNLVASTLLAMPRQSIDESELIKQCDFYQKLISSQPMLSSIIQQGSVDTEEIKRIEQQGLVKNHPHELGDITFLKPEQTILTSYYRNNSLHALVIPSLLACCFLNSRTLQKSKITQIISYVYPFIQSELHLPWTQKELLKFIPEITKFLVKEEVLIESGTRLKRPDRNDIHFLLLTRLAHIIQPILERYYMTFIVLWQSSGNPLTEIVLEKKCHLIAQKVSRIYGINSPDFFDRQLFKHFISTLFKQELISKTDSGLLIFEESFNQINMDVRILLSIEVRSTILQLLRKL